MHTPLKAYGRNRWQIESKLSLDRDIFAYADNVVTGTDGSLTLMQEISGKYIPLLVVAPGQWKGRWRVSEEPQADPEPLSIEYWNRGGSDPRPW